MENRRGHTRWQTHRTAQATQLKNIQARTGKTIAELQAAVEATGLARHGEKRSWLMEHHQLGYGDANAVVNFIGKPLPALDGAGPSQAPAAAADDDPLAALYTGPKAPLRTLHEAVMAPRARGSAISSEAPKKAYVSLRRKKQFAMVGPATREALEIGLNAKDPAGPPSAEGAAARQHVPGHDPHHRGGRGRCPARRLAEAGLGRGRLTTRRARAGFERGPAGGRSAGAVQRHREPASSYIARRVRWRRSVDDVHRTFSFEPPRPCALCGPGGGCLVRARRLCDARGNRGCSGRVAARHRRAAAQDRTGRQAVAADRADRARQGLARRRPARRGAGGGGECLRPRAGPPRAGCTCCRTATCWWPRRTHRRSPTTARDSRAR